METIIWIVLYFAFSSCLHYLANYPKPDVIKKNGKWVLNKDVESGEVISIPVEALEVLIEHDRKIRMMGRFDTLIVKKEYCQMITTQNCA